MNSVTQREDTGSGEEPQNTKPIKTSREHDEGEERRTPGCTRGGEGEGEGGRERTNMRQRACRVQVVCLYIFFKFWCKTYVVKNELKERKCLIKCFKKRDDEIRFTCTNTTGNLFSGGIKSVEEKRNASSCPEFSGNRFFGRFCIGFHFLFIIIIFLLIEVDEVRLPVVECVCVSA